jgi:NADPH:quinone reductase-like Zn-dependent oxidoreductase
MKAIVYTRFGPPEVLQLADPFLIRMMGAGLIKPEHNILGADIAGKVEAIGNSVTQFKPGDEVFGEGGNGGFAEYACVDENRFVLKPAYLTFEAAADHSISDYKRILNSGGIYVLAGGSIARIFQIMLRSMTGIKNMGIMVANINQKDLLFILELFKENKVKSVIDRHYPLSETAEALRYLEEGHACGKVIITVCQ